MFTVLQMMIRWLNNILRNLDTRKKKFPDLSIFLRNILTSSRYTKRSMSEKGTSIDLKLTVIQAAYKLG